MKYILKKGFSYVAKSDIFSEEVSVYLREHIQPRYFPAGAVVVHQGEQSTSLFIIVEDEVEVLVRMAEGQSIGVGELKAGDIFGETSLLTRQPRTATIIART